MSSSSKWVGNSFEMSSKFKMFEFFSAETRSPKWVRTQNEFGTHFRTHPKGVGRRSVGRPLIALGIGVKKWSKSEFFLEVKYCFACVSYSVQPSGLTSPPSGGCKISHPEPLHPRVPKIIHVKCTFHTPLTIEKKIDNFLEFIPMFT